MSISKSIGGGQEIDAETVITFPLGVPGFAECTRYTLFHHEKDGKTIYRLQSLDREGLAFTLVDPTLFGLNYELTLTDEEQALIGAEDPADIAVLLMLAKPAGGEEGASLHANIAGPLILNTRSRLGLQKILAKVDYSLNLQEV